MHAFNGDEPEEAASQPSAPPFPLSTSPTAANTNPIVFGDTHARAHTLAQVENIA